MCRQLCVFRGMRAGHLGVGSFGGTVNVLVKREHGVRGCVVGKLAEWREGASKRVATLWFRFASVRQALSSWDQMLATYIARSFSLRE